jgi:hypothetical protein
VHFFKKEKCSFYLRKKVYLGTKWRYWFVKSEKKFMDEILRELNNLQQKYAQLVIENWLSNTVFTWNWWFLVFLFIVPWIIFLKLLNRKKSSSIWFFGLVIIIITTFIDDLGSELNLWIYPYKFVPVSLLAWPFDFSIIPVSFMLIYQYFQTWKTFTIALLVLAVTFAFIGEPISVWAGTVYYFGWKYSYSFVFYILSGILARVFTQKCVSYSDN